MKAFITGGSGFIGRSLIQKLVKKGYEVRALARSQRSQAIVESLGAIPIQGDLDKLEVLKEAMLGCDLVFHVAGQYKYGVKGTQNMDRINVQGTENVLKTAWEAGVPRILYTSTIAVLGDTKGKVVDETFFQGPPWRNDYDRTKWLAHHEVALPLIQKGAPIIILMPGAVYGPGDTSMVHDLMWFYYKGALRYFFPGTDTRLAFAHVDDTAEGHILAAEKGRIGECYLLGGEIKSLQEIAGLWAKLLQRRPPLINIPAGSLAPFMPLMDLLDRKFSLPPYLSAGAISLLGATYIASSEKAIKELGWQTRPLQEGMAGTLKAIGENETPYLLSPRQKRLLSILAINFLIFRLTWQLFKRKKK